MACRWVHIPKYHNPSALARLEDCIQVLMFVQDSESGEFRFASYREYRVSLLVTFMRSGCSLKEMHSGYSTLRPMHSYGTSRLPLCLGEEEGGWEYLTNGPGVYTLSVSGCERSFERIRWG